MSEESPKSALEIAMEKLRRKDREEGREESSPLDERQKKEIAGIRARTEAKLAELEIMHQSNLQKAAHTTNPEEIEKIEESYRRDRKRLEEDRDSKIAKVRRGR